MVVPFFVERRSMKRKYQWLKALLCILLCVLMVIPEVAAACTTCSYKTVYSYENATHHSYLSECTVCGETKSGWGYSGWSTHSFSSGTCTDCGYTCSHSFSDGTCTKCSYTCSHSNSKKVYSYENVSAGYHQHSYVTSCNTCGKTLTGWGYSGWSSCSYATSGSVTCTYCKHTCSHNLKTTYVQKTDEKHAKTVSCSYGCAYGGTSQEGHNFVGDTCDLCGYTKVSSCSHTYTYTNHGSFTYNGTSYTHKGTCSKCQHVTYASKINDCSVCNPALVTAKVTMSVSGDMEVTSLPASYTVTAKGTNCNVTSIYWLDSSGKKYTVATGSGSSLSYTYTATSESNFPHSREYHCTTSVSGVSGTTSVNFTFAKYAAAGIKWSKDGSTLRTISLNGKVIRDGLSIRLSSYQGATTSIPETYRSAIESAIGTVQPGVTYSLTCYGNAFSYYSADGMAITNRLADYYLYNQLDAMLSSQQWSTETKSAISSYRVMSAVLETSKPVSVTVNWVEVDANGNTVKTIGTKSMYGATKVYPSKNQAISVSYGSGPAALSDYNYVSTAWSGTTSGTSEERTYQESYTVNSSPLTVTFYAKKKAVTGDITVKVIDANTGAAISGASVSGGGSGTTSSAGTVQFTGLALGSYTFNASATGYNSGSGSGTISESQTSTTVTIKLTPIPTTGSITVKVVDANTGAAISGASITGGGSGTTSSAGTVTFSNVPFGTYTYSASKSGYYGNSGSATISLSAQTATVTIRLTPIPTSGTITVKVVDAVTGSAISGASITGGGTGTTSSAGTVTFSNVPFGTYSYSASKTGYYSGSGSGTISLSVQSTTVTIKLTPIPTTGSITVKVVDANTGAAISGARITGGKSGTTSGAGTVSFANVAFGTYSFTASKSGYLSNSASATISLSAQSTTVTIKLTPVGAITVYVRDKATNALISGASVTGSGSGTTNSAGAVSFGNLQIGTYSYSASKAGYISGSGSASVTKAGDSPSVTIYLMPIGSVTVYVRDKATNALISGASITGSGTGTTSSSGTVSFGNLQIGTYSYTASKSGYIGGSGSASVTKAGDSLSVTIYLTPIGSVTVYVRDKATNALISGASITGSGSGTTNSSGSVSFGSLQIGTYSYTASKSGYISGSGSASVTKAGDSLSVTIYLTPIGSVTVYVRDKATNALISGATITGSGTGTTSSSGTVTFGNLQIGTYNYTASKSGYLSGTGSASVTKAGDNLSVTIYLTPIGSVTVYVRDGNTNALISGATVSGAGTSGTTNSSGAVRFNNLQINTYSFTASASGYISGSGSASVTKAGDSLSVTIYLTPIGSITVYVRDQVTNALISGATVSGSGTSGTTNSSGAVRFNNLQINTYTFSASASGYRNGSVSASVTKAGDAITATIYLTPIGSITVYARDKDTNALLSGVTIAGAGTSGTTNTSGAVRFSNLTMGTYSFTATKYGYTSGTGMATLTYAGQATSVTIYLENRTADVSITANPINGTVYRGSQIMVAATVHNDSVLIFKNTNPLSVTMTARKDGSTVISTQTKTVICPANESNLVWFPVDVPASGYSAGNVQFTFSVSVPSGYVDPDMTNNTSSKTVTASVLPQRQVPDPDFQLEAPSSFTYSKYQNNTANTRTWSVWEWNGSFVKRTYDASLTTKAALSPDATAGWSKYNSTNQLWTTRSGYGFNTAVTVSLSGVTTDMFAGHAKVNAYYPEFGYTSAQDKSSMLRMESENTGGYKAEFTFASNTDTISKNKMHVTPVWFPDGAYSVKYEVYDVWTPSGVLTAGTYAIINIEGSMYDDYYTQRN